jgi:hypothetical protein
MTYTKEEIGRLVIKYLNNVDKVRVSGVSKKFKKYSSGSFKEYYNVSFLIYY